MQNLYVISQDMSILGVIDSYESVIWRPAYNEIGDFEIYMGASREMMDLLRINRYVARSKDASFVTGSGAIFKNVMIIKNVELVTDAENGDHIIVTGRELKYILHQRVVWEQTNLSGTAENAIRTLVNQNAISPSDEAREIPGIALDTAAGFEETIEKQISDTYLDEAIEEICQNYNYGWDVYMKFGQMLLRVYQGLDRSFGQDDRAYVVFSDGFDNLKNTDYQLMTEEFANCAKVGGEGEGTDRTYTIVGGDYEGLNRYETYVDARDISSNDGEITSEEYEELLQERGAEKLAELKYTEGFSGEILSDTSFKYGQDFNLGDVVTVINAYGITKNVRVLSAIESISEEGEKLIPQFNI